MGHAEPSATLEQRVAEHFNDSATLKLAAAKKLAAPLALSPSGNSASIVSAVHVARETGIRVVALTGNGGGKMAAELGADDVHVCVPHTRTMRIQEVHLLALHCLCDGIDFQLYGEK